MATRRPQDPSGPLRPIVEQNAMQARDLMSTSPCVVPPETPVAALAELLAARGISALPVVDAAGTAVGIVTEGDLIRRLADGVSSGMQWFLGQFRSSSRLAGRFAKAHGATARDVMTTDLATVGEDATAGEIARLMERRGIRRVLVLRDGALVGLVSRADLLRAVLAPSAAAADGAGHDGAGDDGTILRAVFAAMREQPWTSAFWTFPSVSGGVVTWYGYARSDAVRHGLHALAGTVPGVKQVVDKTEPMPAILRLTF